MTTYFFIGVSILIGAAIFFTLRNDESKSKEIKKLQGRRDSLCHTIDLLNDELELLRTQNNLLHDEKIKFKKEVELLENYSKKLEDKRECNLTEDLLQTISTAQLKRWEQLVADCKKPFAGRKRPINVGGLFTRKTIIAIGEIIEAIKNCNEGAAQ